MKTFVLILTAVSLVSATPSGAQTAQKPAAGPLAAVQSTLKEQQFYFGEVTGVIDDETRSALRRFQIHRGLAVTGEADAATLQTLQSAATDADSRSVRALAQETVQSDQQFLDRLETTNPAPTVGTGAAAPATTTRTEIAVAAPEPAVASEAISPEEGDSFVRAYLQAAEGATPEKEVSFYADQVNYFQSGRVSRRFVEKDQRNYYRRWPSRDFKLVGDPELLRASEDRASVRFRIRYSLRGPEGSAQGTTENIVQLRRTEEGLKIAGIQERKLQQ